MHTVDILISSFMSFVNYSPLHEKIFLFDAVWKPRVCDNGIVPGLWLLSKSAILGHWFLIYIHHFYWKTLKVRNLIVWWRVTFSAFRFRFHCSNTSSFSWRKMLRSRLSKTPIFIRFFFFFYPHVTGKLAPSEFTLGSCPLWEALPQHNK